MFYLGAFETILASLSIDEAPPPPGSVQVYPLPRPFFIQCPKPMPVPLWRLKTRPTPRRPESPLDPTPAISNAEYEANFEDDLQHAIQSHGRVDRPILVFEPNGFIRVACIEGVENVDPSVTPSFMVHLHANGRIRGRSLFDLADVLEVPRVMDEESHRVYPRDDWEELERKGFADDRFYVVVHGFDTGVFNGWPDAHYAVYGVEEPWWYRVPGGFASARKNFDEHVANGEVYQVPQIPL